MKKMQPEDLFPERIQITELDEGQLEGVWVGIVNYGCVNTGECGRGGEGTNCGNIELCLVACGAET